MGCKDTILFLSYKYILTFSRILVSLSISFSMAFFSQDYLLFFQELSANNNKDWFDINRKRYEKNVKVPFSAFTQHMIGKFNALDPSFNDLLSKDCVFRINRDIRFSKDKTPYKLMCSAVIAPNGKKSKSIDGVYFEMTPEHFRVYGGIYEMEKEDILSIREGISQNLSEFESIITESNFLSLYGSIQGAKNKIISPELREQAKIQELIYNKQWYFYKSFPAATILEDNLDELLFDAFMVGRPLQQFFNQFI